MTEICTEWRFSTGCSLTIVRAKPCVSLGIWFCRSCGSVRLGLRGFWTRGIFYATSLRTTSREWGWYSRFLIKLIESIRRGAGALVAILSRTVAATLSFRMREAESATGNSSATSFSRPLSWIVPTLTSARKAVGGRCPQSSMWRVIQGFCWTYQDLLQMIAKEPSHPVRAEKSWHALLLRQNGPHLWPSAPLQTTSKDASIRPCPRSILVPARIPRGRTTASPIKIIKIKNK